jgi:hypothetical protein
MGRSLTAERLRDEMDQLCWDTMDLHVPRRRPAGHRTSRPSSYAELEVAAFAYELWPDEINHMPWTWPGFEHAWSNFLHEFFYWRLADFFTEPPPQTFPLEYQALLAGAAEYLCNRYDLDLPVWIDEPRYRMPILFEMWPRLQWETRFRRVQRSAPEFLKRNLVFEARGLITL